MKKIFVFLIFLVIIKLFFFYPSDNDIQFKLKLIKNEISRKGYNTNWVIISEKRSKLYNDILSNSSKDSYHLKGKAIDIYIFDINGDKDFNYQDIEIIKSANDEVEKQYPRLKGAFGTYTNKGKLSRRMIHLDVRGYSKSYNK